MRIIDLKDRFARSIVAGTFASIILLALNLFSYYILHFSNRRFINYSAILIFGRVLSNNPSEIIISSIAQICFSISIIVISSYLILKEKRKNYFLRGLSVGFASWFAISSLSYIIGIHSILPINSGSAISFMVTSLIWGILSAWFLLMLDERYGNQIETK